MRFSDLKRPIYEARDFQIDSTEHELQVLIANAKDLPDDDPVKARLAGLLNNISNGLANFLNRIGAKAKTPESVTEAVSDQDLEASEQNLFDQLEAFKAFKASLSPEQLAQFSTLMDDANKTVNNQLKAATQQITKENEKLKQEVGAANARAEEVEKFFSGLLPLLRQLGNKVNDYTELTDEDLAAMKGTEKSQAKKKAVNAEKFANTLAEAMTGKVLKLLSEGKTTTEDIKNFLQACLDGKVINLLDMVKSNKGLIDNYVNDEYKNDYHNFVEENIFSYSPGATSGAIGPGELALAMLGDPANKATTGGDLYIGDTLFEIKAGKGTSGGRMNSKKIVSATAGYPVWEKGINKILRDAKAEGKIKVTNNKGKEVNIPLQTYDGSTHNKTGKGYKKGSNYNFNPSGIKALNNDILVPYAAAAAKNTSNSTSPKDVTYELFHDSFKALIGNWEEIPNADKVIYNAINEDGTVDYDTMAKAYTSLAYRSYQLADEVMQILFIRTDTRHFAIIENHDDFMGAIDEKRVNIGSGFTWNDDQQTPTPTYLSAKHG
jgi:hypothetical protein